MPKGIKGFQKGHPNYNLKVSEETKKNISLSKMGDKNPTKQQWVREKISKSVKALGQTGDKSPAWKGDDVSCSGVHSWVRNNKKKLSECELCGASSKGRRFDWANKDHSYKRVLEDYMWICRSCHRKWDIKYNNYKGSGQNY